MEAICPKSELQPLSLGNAPKGRPLKVFRLDGQPALCNRLREMGFCEDAEVRVISNTGVYICQVCGSKVGLSRQLAESIQVELSHF